MIVFSKEVSALKGGTRPPDGLVRCAQEETRPEAGFHPKPTQGYR